MADNVVLCMYMQSEFIFCVSFSGCERKQVVSRGKWPEQKYPFSFVYGDGRAKRKYLLLSLFLVSALLSVKSTDRFWSIIKQSSKNKTECKREK